MQVRQEPPQGRAADSRNRRALSKPLPRQRPCLTGRKKKSSFLLFFPLVLPTLLCFYSPNLFLVNGLVSQARFFFFAAAVLRMPVVVALADALQKAKFAKAF